MARLNYEIIENEILKAFEKHAVTMRDKFGKGFPIRLNTRQIGLLLNREFSSSQIRAACSRLVDKGSLISDPEHSTPTLKSWRYVGWDAKFSNHL